MQDIQNQMLVALASLIEVIAGVLPRAPVYAIANQQKPYYPLSQAQIFSLLLLPLQLRGSSMGATKRRDKIEMLSDPRSVTLSVMTAGSISKSQKSRECGGCGRVLHFHAR
ncbi:hypothetical protein RHMOL_Rhmol03G0019800 [Rhododendron molle]|uniref:Uncharacterized protein n=1 Tax=Rhododendron molle TaxID=49168 RepID=A0ACC0PAP9_RHOML|nr:hypothetical protein RHMOL_Rhmol03G0019800 [Rhododendron molle]